MLSCSPSCPIHEIAHLGRTMSARAAQILAYFTTGRASNGAEAINGTELHRRITGVNLIRLGIPWSM